MSGALVRQVFGSIVASQDILFGTYEAASPGRSNKDKNWRSPTSSPSKRVISGEIKSTGQGLKA